MLVLASHSPRRQEILRHAGLEFLVRPAGVDESLLPGEEPTEHVRRLARAKAEAVTCASGEIILGADTVVVVDEDVLGKPRSPADAERMLRLLSGRAHQVITGFCLRTSARVMVDEEVTSVWFRPLSPSEIAGYAAGGEPMDKAGAYAIQGLASKFIYRIEGCYFNVVGLPISKVYGHLRSFVESFG